MNTKLARRIVSQCGTPEHYCFEYIGGSVEADIRRMKEYVACVRQVEKETKGGGMTINQFAVEVSKQEGKAKQMSIAQIKELLRVVNDITDGELYRMIRKITLVKV